MTDTATDYRYVQTKKKKESQFNVHVKEMIEMIKNEEIKQNLYVKGVKLSKHALERIDEHFDVSNLATATRMIKDMLKKAKRIGAVLAFDGRINILYAYDKTAIYLSPNLKTVVTINRYKDCIYEPIKEILEKNGLDKESIVQLHYKYLKEIEREEKQQVKKMLDIEEKVREANSYYETILTVGRGGRGRKMKVKEMISQHNHELKREGWKLFKIKVEKRHICKSLVSFT